MLVILDPSLRSFVGHFLTYDTSIANEAQRLGVPCTILASRDVEEGLTRETGSVVPCFRYRLESPLREPVVKRAFFTDLVTTAASLPLHRESLLFMHTTTHRQIEPAVRALQTPPLRQAKLVLMLRYSIAPNPYFPDSRSVSLYREALSTISHLELESRVRLVTDSELLRTEYGLITDLPIGLLPIPHAAPKSEPPREGPNCLVYLGNARSTKGFHYLPYVISQIRRSLRSGEWSAELQANVMFKRDKESVAAVSALRREPVTLWERGLSLKEYDGLVDRSSLVVIPYQTLYYHSQSSGVFADAIGRGKPVVVPRGTWMAGQLQGTGAGRLFAPGDRADLAGVVIGAMTDIDELREGAKRMQEGWIARHNPQAFTQKLLELVT